MVCDNSYPLTIIIKRSILDVAAALDPPLACNSIYRNRNINNRINHLLERIP